MVERIARGEVGGEELHPPSHPFMHSGTRGEVSKKARPSVLGGRTRSSTRTSSRRRCRPRLGGFPQRRRAGGAPVASHGPDGSIPDWAARPLTSQARSRSWERWATSLCHEHRRRRGRRTSAPVAASTAVPPRHLAGSRVARIVDDTGLSAIGVDRSVWLDARGEDGPGQRVGPVRCV